MRFVFTLFIVCIAQYLFAQQWPFEKWHDGKVVLATNDTLRGLVKYDLQQNVIQFAKGESKIETFAARKTLFFEIFDTAVHLYRRFYVLPFANNTGYEAPIFFELLTEGKLTLLSREALELRTYSSPYYMGTFSRQVLVDRFFFLDDKGIKPFTGNKKDFLRLTGRSEGAINDFIKSNRLDIDNKYDFAKVVGYYNSLYADR